MKQKFAGALGGRSAGAASGEQFTPTALTASAHAERPGVERADIALGTAGSQVQQDFVRVGGVELRSGESAHRNESLDHLGVDEFRLVALLLHGLLQEAVHRLVHLSGHQDVSPEVPVWGSGLSRKYLAALEEVQRPLFQQTPSKFDLLEVRLPSRVIHQTVHYVEPVALEWMNQDIGRDNS